MPLGDPKKEAHLMPDEATNRAHIATIYDELNNLSAAIKALDVRLDSEIRERQWEDTGEEAPDYTYRSPLVFSDLQRQSHYIAKANGFWDDERNIPEMLALIHSEISEALECIREHPNPTYVNYDRPKPEGFVVELADAVIRIMDLAEFYNLELAEIIRMKMEYNATRKYKHGKKF